MITLCPQSASHEATVFRSNEGEDLSTIISNSFHTLRNSSSLSGDLVSLSLSVNSECLRGYALSSFREWICNKIVFCDECLFCLLEMTSWCRLVKSQTLSDLPSWGEENYFYSVCWTQVSQSLLMHSRKLEISTSRGFFSRLMQICKSKCSSKYFW